MISKYKSLPVQVKASFWFLLCSFLQRGVSVITTPIFTRLLTTDEYGQSSVFDSWMGIITIIVTLNLSAGVYQRGLVAFEKERAVFSSALQGLTLVLALCWAGVYLLSPGFWNRLFGLTAVHMLAMLVMVWTSVVFNFWSVSQKTMYQYRALVIITIIVSVVKPALGVFFVLNSEDRVTARILALMLAQLVMYAWAFFLQMHQGRKFFVAKFWKYALHFNIPLIPHYLSQTVLSSSDRIMVQRMVSAGSAGIYSLAYSLSMVMTMFNTSLMDTLSPWMYTRIRDRDTKSLAPVAYGSLALIAGVNLMLIAFAPEAVAVFAPEEYYEAIWCIPPVAMSVYFIYTYDLFARFTFFYEKTKLIAAATMVGAVANIVLNVIFIRIFGYIAAAYTTLACYMLYSAFHYFAMRRACREELDGEYPYSTKILLLITAVFLGLGFAYLASYGNIWARHLITASLCMAAIIKRKRVKQYLVSWKEMRKKDVKRNGEGI